MAFACQRTDLPDDLRDFVTLSVAEGARTCRTRAQLCSFVRDSMELRTGEPWHVVGGRTFSFSIRYRRGTLAIFTRQDPKPMRVLVFQSSGTVSPATPEDEEKTASRVPRSLQRLDSDWPDEERDALMAEMEAVCDIEDPVTLARAAKAHLTSLSGHDGWHVLVGRAREFDCSVRPAAAPRSRAEMECGPVRLFAFRHRPEDAAAGAGAGAGAGTGAGATREQRRAIEALSASVPRRPAGGGGGGGERAILIALYAAAVLAVAGAVHVRHACDADSAPAEAAAAIESLFPPVRTAAAWLALRAATHAPAAGWGGGAGEQPETVSVAPEWVERAAASLSAGSSGAAGAGGAGEGYGGGAGTAEARLLGAAPGACTAATVYLGFAAAAALIASGAARMVFRKRDRAMRGVSRGTGVRGAGAPGVR